jgi:hypothetical protein
MSVSINNNLWVTIFASAFKSWVSEGTGNKTIRDISGVCKELSRMLGPVLIARRFEAGVHRLGFYSLHVTDMKKYRNELFSMVVETIKGVGTKTELRYSGENTYQYWIEKDGALIGRVAVTPVNTFWLEIEISSVRASRFIKEKTVKLFPTFDTQGWFIAVDNGVDRVVRVERPLVRAQLSQQIRSICLA